MIKAFTMEPSRADAPGGVGTSAYLYHNSNFMNTFIVGNLTVDGFFKILGAVYVTFLLIKMLYNFYGWLRGRFDKKPK